MKIEPYFAKSMDEAISKARVELGSDALLNTRRLPDSGSGAGYEVDGRGWRNADQRSFLAAPRDMRRASCRNHGACTGDRG
jgi:flagellar biosynthesis GTPase FlhF